MPCIHDTIAALATPQGVSAIALLRVSGERVQTLVREIFGDLLPPPRCATHSDYHGQDGRLLDDVLYTWFKAPNSYTGEDSLELSCHGNPYIAQALLEDLFKRGCRPANPGEFTQRAFLNGRMDLSQAEAVMDLIHARSERALETAQRQLRGALGQKMEGIIQELLGSLAQVEAYIDFPEEDLPSENRAGLLSSLQGCRANLSNLLATSHYGEILRAGIQTVIIGEPNAGKSSLLNRLVGRNRAIVSAQPGTTRDFIEECIQVGPHCLRLIDTAGLNPNPEALEKLGIEKTMERISEADLCLVVLDPAQPCPPLPSSLLEKLSATNTRVVLNKSDLDLPPPSLPMELQSLPLLQLSALKGDGIEQLRQELHRMADSLQVTVGNDLIAINARHSDALDRARQNLDLALAKLKEKAPVELLASDLRASLDACGEISGKIDNERMLDQLFSTFCIGK